MAKAKKNDYEDLRQKRIEENLKRMAELNLPMLSQNLRNLSPKPSPMKHSKPRTPRKELIQMEVRRSSRVANLPAPVYKEVAIEVFERISRGRRVYSGRRKDLENRVYASDEAREYATSRAEELESNLADGYPSFVKPMLQSHVTGGFWLGLPAHFCQKYLPKRDEMITLVDEEGEEYPTKYLALKAGLSAGWRGFAIAHELVDGDALVFELVRQTEWKVYIIRVNGSNDDEPAQEMDAE